MWYKIWEMGTDIMIPVDVIKNLSLKQIMDMNIMFGGIVYKKRE